MPRHRKSVFEMFSIRNWVLIPRMDGPNKGPVPPLGSGESAMTMEALISADSAGVAAIKAITAEQRTPPDTG